MSLDLMRRVWSLGIPATAKMVLLSLADQAKDDCVCWPSQPQIAKRCSLTERAVRSQLLWLEGADLLHREVKAGIGTTFTLTLPDANELRHDVPLRKNIPPRNDVPATPEQYSGNPGTTFRQIISKRKEPEVGIADKRSVSSKTTTLSSAWFNQFWAAYPKRKSKGSAEKAWKKLQPDAELLDQILKAIEVAKTRDDWRKNGGQFIPYPATWLNARGWEDDAPATISASHAIPQDALFRGCI